MKKQDDKQPSSNPILRLFKKIGTTKEDNSAKLFSATPEDVDLKTDLIYPEDVLISRIKFNDQFLKDRGLNTQFTNYIDSLLRARFSLERKSREEFVTVNTKPLQSLQMPTEIKNIEETRK